MLDRQALKLRLKSMDKTRVIQSQEVAPLLDVLDEFLTGVKSEGRDVEDWEANCLYAAIDAMKKHRFGLGRANLLHALEITHGHNQARRQGVTLDSLSAGAGALRSLLSGVGHVRAA